MSWPRRHELIDLDLDAYADEADESTSAQTQPASKPLEDVVVPEPVSVLNAAERAGIPIEVLLPKLDP